MQAILKFETHTIDGVDTHRWLLEGRGLHVTACNADGSINNPREADNLLRAIREKDDCIYNKRDLYTIFKSSSAWRLDVI